MARRRRAPLADVDSLPDAEGEAGGAVSGPDTEAGLLVFDAYLAGNNTSRQALGAGGQDGEAWLCLEISRESAADLLRHFHRLTGRAFEVRIVVGRE